MLKAKQLRTHKGFSQVGQDGCMLRNLVWATSKHDVYVMSNFSVIHWSSLSFNSSVVLNFSGHIAPSEKHPGSLLEGFTETQISTLAVKENLLVAGGFQGELIYKRIDRQGVSFCTRITSEENAITNAIEVYRGSSPENNLVTIVGDHPDGQLIDSRNGKVVTTVVGHLDYSFASAWHPNGYNFATGNQDKTCRVWDVRNLSSSIAVLKNNMGAARSIRYSSDGRFMAVAEPADFVHIYNTDLNYQKRQEIDLFGEISGISLSPDDESLFIGICDRTYASLVQYKRRHHYSHLDSVL
ncbi:hypothetical protein QJS04_geneDACA004359 [Acorus gramineus]|uniref:Uncharacterized protein n=1 Tax=Acorus gramineus TaxID=55184 RepID=A0AAV9B1N6_ACOGR|nr:hypothetical protein QJS04_geneDACA004359 [Acorus gramineus]